MPWSSPGRYLGGEYVILFNGIEISRFAAAEPAPTEGPTVFFLGRHEERKGLQVLLGALSYLPADVRIWVAGDGPLTPSLQAEHAGDARIEWLGRITDAERAARLRGADLYCAPSLGGESFGVVLLEAMAAGVPIVASDLKGYANVARSEVEAVLVEPGAPEELARGIVRVLGDRDACGPSGRCRQTACRRVLDGQSRRPLPRALRAAGALRSGIGRCRAPEHRNRATRSAHRSVGSGSVNRPDGLGHRLCDGLLCGGIETEIAR